MKLRIERESLDPASIGVLYIDGARECHTLELPWKDNRSNISCIPPGVYRVTWEESPRLKRNTLRLHGVPDRDGILIHSANWTSELRGCIAFGIRDATNPEHLMESRRAVQRVEIKVLAAIKRGAPVTIEIINPKEVPHG